MAKTGQKNNTRGAKSYIIRVLDGMARGLFASLIIGLIINQIGIYTGLEFLAAAGKFAQFMMGPAIGAGVALTVGAPPLAVLAAIAAGALGAGTVSSVDGVFKIAIGDPASACLAGLIGAELGKVVSGKTKFDIILVPGATIIVASLIGYYISPYVSFALKEIGAFINLLASMHPLPMGILLAVVMGMVLTLPISSAAIAISLGMSGIAGGAATIGCCCQMIGFAVISYKDNGLGGFIAQGLGTSMLQMGNIVRNPWIWLPPTLASAILGPVASVVLKMTNTPIGSGMGTSGLVGQIGTLNAMGQASLPLIGLMHFLLPALLSYGIYGILRKAGKIKPGDMSLNTK